MTAGTDTVAHLFAATFGGSPAGFWRAPGRVNLIGEHTDYNDGFVLPFAIDRATTIALSPRDDRRIRLVSTFDEAVVESDLDAVEQRAFTGWSAYPLGVAWAIGERRGAPATHGFDVAIDSDVPVGAGLSSSAAIEMAVAVALNDVWGLGFDRGDLARIGQRAENIAVGAPTGIMDQSASVFGQADAAVFLDCRSLAVEQVPLGFDAAGLVLLVVDTKVEHSHATGGYRDRRDACERGAAAMGVAALRDLSVDDLPRAQELLDDVTFRRVRHVVTEDARVLESVAALKAGDLVRFGELMDASHVSMRDDFEISVPQLDAVVEAAQAAGAVGARMTGGGFGGCAIALLPADEADALAADVLQVFAERGWREPVSFTVIPSDGARAL
ncbi:galactokinase [Amnibacterium kyonggiense]|uniref:Galactokinase n=1 Tax=Amnibacterium kyonggiense TaxID=595671 RepID=A0A4R7FPA2_9MICO|nr:galactokinase [Amnibacterium kyonggiense]TDS79565.1 galactokinase [Amnibacterium kyonggiense]